MGILGHPITESWDMLIRKCLSISTRKDKHIEAWRSLEDEGVKWLTCLFNKIFSSAKMSDEWRLSEVIPIYKNKGDTQACSNYRGIKLLSHTIKLWERVIERRLRRETKVSENQFGFMLRRSTTEVAIRPAMLYGSECWPITKAQATRVEVAELRMMMWIYGKTMIYMIPNRVFIAELEVDSIVDKMREWRLRWFGHVKRRPRNAPVRRVEAMEVEGSRRRGRPKLRWEDRLKMDKKERVER
nr:retrovirus-related Pol polyprotein LINE-1 [Tanacetum cinerariifolium]